MNNLLSIFSNSNSRSQNPADPPRSCANSSPLVDDDEVEWGPFEGPSVSNSSIGVTPLRSTFSREDVQPKEKKKKKKKTRREEERSHAVSHATEEAGQLWSREVDEEEWDAWAEFPQPSSPPMASKSTGISSERFQSVAVKASWFLQQRNWDEDVYRPALDCSALLYPVPKEPGNEPTGLYTNPWYEYHIPTAEVPPSGMCDRADTTAEGDQSIPSSPSQSSSSPACSSSSLLRQGNLGEEGCECFANPWDDCESFVSEQEATNSDQDAAIHCLKIGLELSKAVDCQ